MEEGVVVAVAADEILKGEMGGKGRGMGWVRGLGIGRGACPGPRWQWSMQVMVGMVDAGAKSEG